MNYNMSYKNKYFYDNESDHKNACKPKQFVGMYLYYGLYTFDNENECVEHWNKHHDHKIHVYHKYNKKGGHCESFVADKSDGIYYLSKQECEKHNEKELKHHYNKKKKSLSCGCGF